MLPATFSTAMSASEAALCLAQRCSVDGAGTLVDVKEVKADYGSESSCSVATSRGASGNTLRRRRQRKLKASLRPASLSVTTQTEESGDTDVPFQCLEDKLATYRKKLVEMKLKLIIPRGKVAALRRHSSFDVLETVSAESDVSEASETLDLVGAEGEPEVPD